MEGLTRAFRSRRSGPIGGNEIDAPEMGRGSEELKTYALAFLCGITKKHDAAFLLFLRERVGDDEFRVLLERLVQIHQATVRINHDCFAGFAKTAAVGVFPGDDHTHAHKDPGTASSGVEFRLRHDSSMLRHIDFAVNDTVNGVFPHCNLEQECVSHAGACVCMCLRSRYAL
jgi:hypothetical protein